MDAPLPHAATLELECGERLVLVPKSDPALAVLDEIDAVVRPLVALQIRTLDRLNSGTLPDDAHAVLAAQLDASLQPYDAMRLWLWGAAHPAPGLPFDLDAESVEIPAWTASLTLRDVAALAGAFYRVNADALTRRSGGDPTHPHALSTWALRFYEVLP